jgi:hypothetical protein
MTATDATGPLVARVRQTRTQVDHFIAGAVPRKRRLMNITIIGGTLAAALTAAPAMGGQPFTAWLTAALGLDGPSWRLLCGAASLSSIAATVSTQLLKSTHLEEHLARATTEYLKCVEDASHFGGA